MTFTRFVLAGTSSGGGVCEGSFVSALLNTLSAARADSSPAALDNAWEKIPALSESREEARWRGVICAWPLLTAVS